MGNEQVKGIINKYLTGDEELSEEEYALMKQEYALMKQEITRDTYLRFDLPGTETYYSVIRDLHHHMETPLSEHDTYMLDRTNSILTNFLVYSLAYELRDLRKDNLCFDAVPTNELTKYFLHSARSHPLREATVGKKESIFGNIDMDALKHLAWTDHDNDGYSGSLIFVMYGEGFMCGGVAAIDNNKDIYKLYYGNVVASCTDMVDKCLVRSLFVPTEKEEHYKDLFNLGLLSTCKYII